VYYTLHNTDISRGGVGEGEWKAGDRGGDYPQKKILATALYPCPQLYLPCHTPAHKWTL